MMFLFRWAKWTTASTGSSFPVWQFEFPSRLIFFNPWIGRSVVQHSCSKKVEYRAASDRSSLRIERAYFTQFSPCCDNSDDDRHYGVRWTCQEIWTEGTRVWLNHSFNHRGGVRGCLICVSRIARTFLIYPTDRCCAFYGLHDCNSVHYQCGLPSIVLRFFLHYSRLMMICFADATLAGELLSISVYTVYAIIFDGSCLTHFMTTATLIISN